MLKPKLFQVHYYPGNVWITIFYFNFKNRGVFLSLKASFFERIFLTGSKLQQEFEDDFGTEVDHTQRSWVRGEVVQRGNTGTSVTMAADQTRGALYRPQNSLTQVPQIPNRLIPVLPESSGLLDCPDCTLLCLPD